jgi:hypothetical protein
MLINIYIDYFSLMQIYRYYIRCSMVYQNMFFILDLSQQLVVDY